MRFELSVFVTRSYSWKLPLMKTRVCYPKIENGNCEPNFLSQKVYTDIYRININIDAWFCVYKLTMHTFFSQF